MFEIKKVFKRKGITMGKLLKETKKHFDIKKYKIAFANRLDPMASGEVIILIGKDSCKRLNEFTKKDKKYNFKFFTNFYTDSLDILGNPKLAKEIRNIDLKVFNDCIKHFDSLKYEQNYPNYSSICVKNNDGLRNPLWWWAKNNRLNEITIPKKNVEIKSLNLNNIELIDSTDLINNIIDELNLLEDDDNGFRKDEIIKNWEKIKDEIKQPIQIQVFDMDAVVSSGTYIRQLVFDMSTYLKCNLATLSIFRPINGILDTNTN